MKKNILIVFAHPNHASLNYELLTKTKKGFIDEGHQVTVLDLYKEKFDPILYFDETHRRRDLQYLDETKKYRDQVSEADHLVFIFPIWWGSMPAIMKGYFEKVFTTGFSYNFKGLLPEGKLKGKTASIITTDDTLSLFRVVALQDYGNVLKRQILRIMTGVKVVKHFRFSYVKGRDQQKIKKWINQCYQHPKQIKFING